MRRPASAKSAGKTLAAWMEPSEKAAKRKMEDWEEDEDAMH